VFWRAKLERNKLRDRLVNSTLTKSGWRVLRIWQHELTRKAEERLMLRIGACLVKRSLQTKRKNTG
jgi:DNA mismatch endonuclease (patch repair protein)